MPEAAAAFRGIVEHIAKEMNIKYPTAMKLAKVYNDKAKAAKPGIGGVAAAEEAIKLFNNDSKETRQDHLRKVEKEIAAKKAAKKEMGNSYSSTSE
jgi:hypothetical protein